MKNEIDKMLEEIESLKLRAFDKGTDYNIPIGRYDEFYAIVNCKVIIEEFLKRANSQNWVTGNGAVKFGEIF